MPPSSIFSSFIFNNTDLFFVGIVVAAIGILGFVVFYNNKTSITNQTFLLLALITITYGVFNYINYQITTPVFVLWFLRFTIFFAVWHAFSFFQFFYVFPEDKIIFPHWYKRWIIPLVASASLITLTPLTFSGIEEVIEIGKVTNPVRGFGIVVFGLTVVSLIVGGFYFLFRKVFCASIRDKGKYIFLSAGVIITFSLILIFNFFLPVFYNELRFIPFAPIFFFPFVAFTAYSIFKHNLFDVKIIASEVLTFTLAVVTLFQIPFSDGVIDFSINILVFILVLVFGILLIKSVVKEVKLREELAVANAQLRVLDQRKSEFVSLASHQLRSPLSVMKGYSSMLLEGSFGVLPKDAKDSVDKIFRSTKHLLSIVEDFLTISRIEQNRLKYEFKSVDFKKLVGELISDTTPLAKKKGLIVSFHCDKERLYLVTADSGKVEQVVGNILDNAVKYTPNGKIEVTLTTDKEKHTIRLSVADSGIGMSQETIDKLFQKFSRAIDAHKTDVTGAGLGLYVARRIVEAHHGRIWAESAGKGEGSTFYMELMAEE